MIPRYMQKKADAGDLGRPLCVTTLDGFDGWDAFRENEHTIVLYDDQGRLGSIRRVAQSSDNRGQNWTLYAVYAIGQIDSAKLTAAILGGYCSHKTVFSWRYTDFVEHYVDSSG